MRPYEIALTISLMLSACSLVSQRLLHPVVWLAVDVCLLLAHLIFEGAHWQMIPGYAAAVLFAAVVVLRAVLHVQGGRIFTAIAMLLLCVGACCLSAILPMFRLPAPTGPYPVGTRVVFLAGGGKGRDLMIQVWYPAEPSRRPYAPYRRRRETTLQSSYQSVLATNSRLEAPVASGSFPVLLFSPAWNGRRTQNTYLTEELASHGYVVAGIDHPGNSGPTLFPDGHVDQPVSAEDMDFSRSITEVRATGDRELERQVADTLQVLDQLERMNGDAGSPFYQRLDTKHAGALGHSFGGAVAAEAALRDSRILAALDLDGSLFGHVQSEGLPKPFMFVEEDLPGYEDPSKRTAEDRINDALNDGDLAMMEKFGGYRIFLHGSSHVSFTDHNLFSPLISLSGAGAIPKQKEFSIIRKYSLAFFDEALRGGDPALLKEVPGPYPEATLEVIRPKQGGRDGGD